MITQHNGVSFDSYEEKRQRERNFSAKVFALQKGFKLLAGVDYSFYCTLDADVSFEPTYFQEIIDKFRKDSRLGIAGGIILDLYDNKLHKRMSSLSNVTGAVQFFCKECFLSTGGFVSSKLGGEDTILEIRAKKKGWKVQSFPELLIYHYRRTGSAEQSLFKSRYKYGITDYCLGNPLLFEFFKCCHRVKEPPYIIGAIMVFCGFIISYFKRTEKFLFKDEIEFVRKEQLKKIWNWAPQRFRFVFK